MKMLKRTMCMVSLAVPLSMSFTVAAEMNSLEVQLWPTNVRSDLTEDQVRLGIMLAGQKIAEIVNGPKCVRHERALPGFCHFGDYGFQSDEGSDRYQIVRRSQTDSSSFETIMITEGSLVFTSGRLKPVETRALSVDLAQTLLGRDLKGIDPKDPDTFFDPTNFNFSYLSHRLSHKLRNLTADRNCSAEVFANFAQGITTDCEIDGVFVRNDGRYSDSVFYRDGEVVSEAFQMRFGTIVVDAAAPTQNSLDLVLTGFEKVLHVERSAVDAIPALTTVTGDRLMAVVRKAKEIAYGKECTDLMMFTGFIGEGASTDCQIGNHFVETDGVDRYTIRVRPDDHSTRPVMYIAGDRPFISVRQDAEDGTDLEDMTVEFLNATTDAAAE